MSVLIANVLSSPLVVQLAVVGGVAAVVWWLLDLMANDKPRTEQRLQDIREPNTRKSDLLRDSKGGNSNAVSKVLELASPALAKPLQPKSEEEISEARSKLTQAGFRAENASEIFWSLKMIGLVGGFFLGGGAVVLTRGFDIDSITYASGIAFLMFFAPGMVLWLITKSRKDNIFYGLPDALDLMVVCVEAGLGLDQAMRKVAEEMKGTYHVIAEEFALCNLQLQMGRARNDVLHDLGLRTGVDDLKALAAILIQADKFGSSVAQALRVQSDSMRTRRRQMAEEKAAKTAVKLIFPLVLFIFPAIFIVLVGPAAITMVNELFPSMSGGS
ncbi:MAG: type II secretion system F family protein [Pirellulales bacterium]|nr:type II secretion system F family protein [Pirellulales bacterium]